MGQVSRVRYNILVGNPEDRRPFVTLKLVWVDTIKLDLTGLRVEECIRLIALNDDFL
jgi:hypothetical protein